MTITPLAPNARGFVKPRPSTPRPACELDPEGWYVDHGGLADWLRAIRSCIECPLLTACWEDRNRIYADVHPAGVIWAGTLYTDDGRPLATGEELVRHATQLLRGSREDTAAEPAEAKAA